MRAISFFRVFASKSVFFCELSVDSVVKLVLSCRMNLKNTQPAPKRSLQYTNSQTESQGGTHWKVLPEKNALKLPSTA